MNCEISTMYQIKYMHRKQQQKPAAATVESAAFVYIFLGVEYGEFVPKAGL